MTILVFGASRGIGRVFADMAAEKGMTVYVFSRSWKENNSPIKPNFIECDFENEADLSEKIHEVCKKHEKIDGVIFCQKYRGQGDPWLGEIAVSMTAVKTAVETAAPYMKNGGAIVAVSSNASHMVAPEQPVSYHMAKAALEQMVRFYAVKYGPKNIRVNAVSPAVTLKPENVDFYNGETGLTSAITSVIPMGRMAHSEDVADVIFFFLTTPFVTGQILAVDGGMTLMTQESIARENYKKVEKQ